MGMYEMGVDEMGVDEVGIDEVGIDPLIELVKLWTIGPWFFYSGIKQPGNGIKSYLSTFSDIGKSPFLQQSWKLKLADKTYLKGPPKGFREPGRKTFLKGAGKHWSLLLGKWGTIS